MRGLGLLPLVYGGQRGLLLLLLALQGPERRLEALVPALVGRHDIHLHGAGLLSHASPCVHMQRGAAGFPSNGIWLRQLAALHAASGGLSPPQLLPLHSQMVALQVGLLRPPAGTEEI